MTEQSVQEKYLDHKSTALGVLGSILVVAFFASILAGMALAVWAFRYIF